MGLVLLVLVGFASLWFAGHLVADKILEKRFSNNEDLQSRWSTGFFALWTLVVTSGFAATVLLSDASGIAKLKPLAPFAVLFGLVVATVLSVRLYYGENDQQG